MCSSISRVVFSDGFCSPKPFSFEPSISACYSSDRAMMLVRLEPRRLPQHTMLAHARGRHAAPDQLENSIELIDHTSLINGMPTQRDDCAHLAHVGHGQEADSRVRPR